MRMVFIIALLFLIASPLWIFSIREKFQHEAKEQKPSIHLVIARFNESLDWLCSRQIINLISNTPIETSIFIYNKNNEHRPQLERLKACLEGGRVSVIPLNNVGHECDTYITHIISNYHNPADVTVFLHGSSNMPVKFSRALAVMQRAYKELDSAFICDVRSDNIMSVFSDYTQEEYTSTNDDNRALNPYNSMELSSHRPFSKWFTHHFGDIDVQCAGYKGIFAVSKKSILSRSKVFYENFREQFRNHSNHHTEACHFLERAWLALFHPIQQSSFIDAGSLS